jgi:hypothetical protein
MNFASNNPFRVADESQHEQTADENLTIFDQPSSAIVEEAGYSTPLSGAITSLDLYGVTTFNVRLTASGTTNPTLFYAIVRNFSPSKPNIVLYDGADKNSPIAGVSKIGPLYISNKIGLGDPSIEIGPDRIEWEELRRLKKWTHEKYGFEYGEKDERKKYEWRRIHGSWKALDGKPNLVLVEEGAAKIVKGADLASEDFVLARYVVGPGMIPKPKGKFEIRQGRDERWEAMVLLTGLTIIETTKD